MPRQIYEEKKGQDRVREKQTKTTVTGGSIVVEYSTLKREIEGFESSRGHWVNKDSNLSSAEALHS